MRLLEKYWPALILPSPALIVLSLALTTSVLGILPLTHLPVNKFRNKLAPNVPSNFARYSPFCFLLHFELFH